MRIGGIYALERIAGDSVRDHPTVMEVLSAFVREHSREQWPPLRDDYQPGADPPERTTRPDVQAAVTVIGRRDPTPDRQSINLADATLAHADLTEANLARAYLFGADLTGAILINAEFARADLDDANLSRANLGDTDLRSARLRGANLSRANLTGADFTGASLDRARFTGAGLIAVELARAHLRQADFTDANLSGADLTGANLLGADFTGAQLSGWPDLGEIEVPGPELTDANLTDALWPSYADVPEGWERDSNSGRLTRIAPATGTERNRAE